MLVFSSLFVIEFVIDLRETLKDKLQIREQKEEKTFSREISTKEFNFKNSPGTQLATLK